MSTFFKPETRLRQYSVTRNLAQSIPPHIFNFGALGTVPYIGTAVGIIFAAREAGAAQAGTQIVSKLVLSISVELILVITSNSFRTRHPHRDRP
jgi:hypothetical protein